MGFENNNDRGRRSSGSSRPGGFGSQNRSGGFGNRSGGSGGFGNRSGGSGSFGNRSGGSGGRSFGGQPREMHKAVCAGCGANCEVPFKPSGERPVYCRDCFAKNKPENRF